MDPAPEKGSQETGPIVHVLEVKDFAHDVFGEDDDVPVPHFARDHLERLSHLPAPTLRSAARCRHNGARCNLGSGYAALIVCGVFLPAQTINGRGKAGGR